MTDFHIQKIPETSQCSPSKKGRSVENALIPVNRPDSGGILASRRVNIAVNHFPVTFNSAKTILHYDVNVKQEKPRDSQSVKKIVKSDLRLIREKLCSDEPLLFPLLKTAYDGDRNIFSDVRLIDVTYKVQSSDDEYQDRRSYEITIKCVNEVKLKDYLSGTLSQVPRDVLQGMDLVMKENLYYDKVPMGRGCYSTMHRQGDDLQSGVAAFRGFQQSLKPTYNGLSMCLDYSVLAFYKRMPVIEFLKERIPDFKQVNDIFRFQREVRGVLNRLKVNVTHRPTKQKYPISGLSDEITRNISFVIQDSEGNKELKKIMLLSYFQEKWGKEVQYKDIPCLNLGKKTKSNIVPMEFCALAECQRLPANESSKQAERKLIGLSVLPPKDRRIEIQRLADQEYGQRTCGNSVIQNFEYGVGLNMTEVSGRVMPPPSLKIGTLNGNSHIMTVDRQTCHRNLLGGKTVVDGKSRKMGLDRFHFLKMPYK